MEYGEIFVGTWRAIWREKRLWLFGLLGLLLTAIGSAAYQAFSMNWQRDYFSMLGRLAESGQPQVLPNQIIGSMAALWLGLGLLMLASFIGYLINLVMRGATIHEAALVWDGLRPDIRRGLRAGLARGIYVFLLDLLWFVPSAVIWGGGYLLAIIALIGLGASSGNSSNGAGAALLSFCGILGCTTCVGLLVLLVAAIFAPLMYQSTVQGQRSAGAAISEGWRLARTHLGAMIVFWILSLAVGFGLGLIMQLITLPFLFPLMSSWLTWMTQLTENAGRSSVPPTFPSLSAPLAFLLSVAIFIGGWLTTSLRQTFDLTMYATVYRRLMGADAASLPAPAAPAPEPTIAAPITPETPAAPDTPVTPTTAATPVAPPSGPFEDLIVPDEETPPTEGGDARPYV
jgi:hypothetical protein